MCELAHGWEVRIAATHIVLLFCPRRVRFQQQCYHRLRLTALLHSGDVQRQPPILSTSQAHSRTWSAGVHWASGQQCNATVAAAAVAWEGGGRV